MAKQAIRFTNFSEEDFVGVWNGEEFLIKKGESILLQDFLAEHFAKHLVDRELNKKKLPTSLVQHRNPLMALCLGNVKVEAESDLKLEQKMMNEPKEEPKSQEKASEEDFEGLEDDEITDPSTN